MKLLDKYVAKNFLIGYAIAFFVLMGLRVIIDLFVNIDEFTENIHLGTLEVIKNIITFYGVNSSIYFRDFAGIITVVAAAFSLGKMVRNNELVAVMASGISLKRVISPIVLLALLLTGLLIIDQELIIPPLADRLVRKHDDMPGSESYDVWFISDSKNSLICSQRFDVKTSTLFNPTIILRKPAATAGTWHVTGWIKADKAVYSRETNSWDLTKGRLTSVSKYYEQQRPDSKENLRQSNQTISSYSTDLNPKNIPVMRKARHKTLLSSRQLSALAAQRTKVRDLAQLYSQKHFRVTDPIINFVMLMISLPILICRDPKAMKSAVMIGFGVTTACFITTFVCKILATEMVFQRIIPEFWAWLPVFIFLPIAFVELDSMKT
ncbi:MAG: LptF/LptG family permease [Sedimentisphaerales bacterium]|nr:LptF/LptG family permease [Sedimentisphaerales bacterium]